MKLKKNPPHHLYVFLYKNKRFTTLQLIFSDTSSVPFVATCIYLVF